jgi:hypothetical protein
MPTDFQYQTSADALAQIRSAERELDTVLASTADAGTLGVLAGVYGQLTSVAASLIQAQTAADDALFAQLAGNLNAQAKSLKASEALIQHVVRDAVAAGKIIGYLTQAAVLIAKL